MTVIRPNSISGVTSITALGDNISFYNSDGVNISQFNANINATSGVSTIANLTVGFITATGTSVSGNVTVGGNVSIAGTLTYEDVTNIDSIGIVTARAGIVLGPTANTIQLGTGTTISSPASNTFTILTGGSERVRVSSAGSFGVGTNNPSARIHGVSLTNDSAPIFRAHSQNLTQYVDIGFYYLNYDNGATTSSFEFQIDGSTKAVLTSAGGFSVGTTANPGAGAIYATGDITAFYSSDIRLKKDIEPISEPIKKLMEISGVTYKWNEEYLKDKEVDGYFVRETEVGVIAQEVEKVLPEVVATRENGYKAVRYEKLVALLIEAVKDQQHQIDELKARLEEK